MCYPNTKCYRRFVTTARGMNYLMPSSSTRSPNLHLATPQQQESLASDTPTSSTQPSPALKITHEYSVAIQTNSYSEIWSKIHVSDHSCEDSETVERTSLEERQFSEQILNPNRESVEEALQQARPSTLIRLVSAYFDHSESASQICLVLRDNVHRARSLYRDLHNLLNVLPLDSDSNCLSQSQCDRAFDVFLKFDTLENPFPCPDSQNFHEMHCCISEFNQKLHRRLCRSRSKVRILHRATTCSAFCLIGTVVGVTICALTIASHALITLAACPLLPAFFPSKISKNEKARLSQLDAASVGTYVLHKYLETIDRLVERLYVAVEDDKLLVRIGLERGRDRHPIQEVAKLLQKNSHNFLTLLTDLEERVCLCLAAINRARFVLLEEIHRHQSL